MSWFIAGLAIVVGIGAWMLRAEKDFREWEKKTESWIDGDEETENWLEQGRG